MELTFPINLEVFNIFKENRYLISFNATLTKT